MPVHVRSIQTAVPSTVLRQVDARRIFVTQPGLTRLGERLVGAAFDASGIETRHTVIDDFSAHGDGERTFFDGATGALLSPSTRERNDVYIRSAGAMFVEAGRAALDACPDLGPADVTHVVTASCTGFYAPGPDFELVRELGLATTVQRTHIGFMGCYAAFPALRAAAAFCRADPDAVVLVVSCEVCTIHVRSSNDPDQIVASSVFGDGAAAAIVTARELPADAPSLVIDRLASELTPVGEKDMAWTIGDAGFDMVLSAAVPKIIDNYIEGALVPLLSPEPELAADPAGGIRSWAIHPGGRSILDKVEAKLGLSDRQLEASRRVLRDFGNMSSATVLFILKDLLEEQGSGSDRVCAMAFGPGLTVETGLFTRVRP
ncbi:type III polyketide synthase [Mycetocola manganoxydans]|uniref:Type III polyketide synthase n=1 Tax=Mycetocola manganoxydans TaxID=699879 RepID=A0A3L6ZY10_9MICO|nr:type III polyketide synthase [Mycetocola manganoxydans]GHD40649.1 naringenin-chalcone synthase [Mycetocola manganoxydans]